MESGWRKYGIKHSEGKYMREKNTPKIKMLRKECMRKKIKLIMGRMPKRKCSKLKEVKWESTMKESTL